MSLATILPWSMTTMRSLRVGLVEVVRGEEDGGAAPVAQVGDVGPEVRAGLRVQPGGRLVEPTTGLDPQARANL